MTTATEPTLPPWMHIAQTYERAGILEVPGDKAHPTILSFFKHTSLKGSKLALSDETAWCSAFACACMEQAGIKSPRSARARDWLKWGVELTEPRPGCIVVFWRGHPTGAEGHVAFFVDGDATTVHVLGGNQRNRVCVAPYERDHVISYRWPKST